MRTQPYHSVHTHSHTHHCTSNTHNSATNPCTVNTHACTHIQALSLSLSLLLLLSTMFIISIVCPHTLHLSLSLFLCCIEGSCKVGSACPGTWILVSTSTFTVGLQRIF